MACVHAWEKGKRIEVDEGRTEKTRPGGDAYTHDLARVDRGPAE